MKRLTLSLGALVVAASIACGPPPVPRAASADGAGSPLGPSYVLLPLPGDDDALLGRVLMEPLSSGRSLEEVARPNPCAGKLSDSKTSPQAATFEDAQELAQGASARAVLGTFGFSADVEVASHFFYKLETSKRVARADTVEYVECCKEKGCGYGYVSALVYGEGEYATGNETKASGGVDVVVGAASGGVRLKVLHKRKVKGWMAALVTITDSSKAGQLGPLGVAAAAGINEASVSDTVKELYERDKIKVEGSGDNYRLTDGRGQAVTENEFIRRFRDATGSHELDPLDRRRNPIKVGILGAATGLSAGLLVYGLLAPSTRPCNPTTDFPYNGDCSGPGRTSANYRFYPQNETKETSDTRTTYKVAGGVGTAAFGLWLVFALLDRDGKPGEHFLTDRDAVLYANQFNRAMLRKTVKDVEKVHQKSSGPWLLPYVSTEGLGLVGRFLNARPPRPGRPRSARPSPRTRAAAPAAPPPGRSRRCRPPSRGWPRPRPSPRPRSAPRRSPPPGGCWPRRRPAAPRRRPRPPPPRPAARASRPRRRGRCRRPARRATWYGASGRPRSSGTRR